MIGWSEIYENAEVLSPIDIRTWSVIAKTAGLGARSRVMELASGKGAFALDAAKKFGCKVDCYDANPDFVKYAAKRAE